MREHIVNYIQYSKKMLLISVLIILSSLKAMAYEEYLIMTNGKLTDISIEDNTVVDVYPLITVMNDKNTLIVSPLKTGKTRVCVLKNNKNIVMFNVEVQENKTFINDVDGFDILSLDTPPSDDFELDLPPMLKEVR